MKGVRRFERRRSKVGWDFVKRQISRTIPPWLQYNSMTPLGHYFAVLVDGSPWTGCSAADSPGSASMFVMSLSCARLLVSGVWLKQCLGAGTTECIHDDS